MTLTRRQINALYVQVKALVHAQLVRSQTYRDQPDLASQKAKLHAQAAIKGELNGKRK